MCQGRRVACTCTLLFGFLAAVYGQTINLLQEKPKRVKLSGYIVAWSRPSMLTTVGRNYHSYLFQIQKKDGSLEIVKLSYRFMHREGDLPSLFQGRSLLHTFKMVREPACDEDFRTLSTSYLFDQSGFQFLGRRSYLEVAKGSEITKLSPDTVLSCYVATPQDYVGTKTHPKRL